MIMARIPLVKDLSIECDIYHIHIEGVNVKMTL